MKVGAKIDLLIYSQSCDHVSRTSALIAQRSAIMTSPGSHLVGLVAR